MRNINRRVASGGRARIRGWAFAAVVCAAGAASGGLLGTLQRSAGGGIASADEANTECAYVITGAGFSPTQPGTTCDEYQVGEVVYTEPCPATGCPYQKNWAIYNGVCEYPARLANPPCQVP